MKRNEEERQLRLDLAGSDVWESLPDTARSDALELCADMILLMSVVQEEGEHEEQ